MLLVAELLRKAKPATALTVAATPAPTNTGNFLEEALTRGELGDGLTGELNVLGGETGIALGAKSGGGGRVAAIGCGALGGCIVCATGV